MPPYPGIPYGPAPPWCFPAFEASAYILFAVCLAHAWRRGKQHVAYILGGLFFGLVLEYIEVATGSYTYGRFVTMLGRPPLSVPICIGLGWGIILYTSRLFSDALRLPLLAAAAFDTLLAINIDLSMDVVAYRLHMWHWHWQGTGLNPLTAQWFGIPYGNFVGWQTVIFCYSAFSRLFERRLLRAHAATTARSVSVALLALLCSQAILFSAESFLYPFLRKHFSISSAERFLFLSAACLVLSLWGFLRDRVFTKPIPPLARWVPCFFHAYFLAAFFGFGFYRENRWMTLAALGNVTLGIIVHFVPWHSRRPAVRLDRSAPDVKAAA